MSAPIVLTSETLSQREARPVVLVSPEEILKMRTESFSKNKSELGFLIRQPSASAIMSAYVELELVLKFRSTVALAQVMQVGAHKGHGPVANVAGNEQLDCQMPEGLPIQSKCVRTAVSCLTAANPMPPI